MMRPAPAGWMMTSDTAWHSTDQSWKTSFRIPAGAGREPCFEIGSSGHRGIGSSEKQRQNILLEITRACLAQLTGSGPVQTLEFRPGSIDVPDLRIERFQ